MHTFELETSDNIVNIVFRPANVQSEDVSQRKDNLYISISPKQAENNTHAAASKDIAALQQYQRQQNPSADGSENLKRLEIISLEEQKRCAHEFMPDIQMTPAEYQSTVETLRRVASELRKIRHGLPDWYAFVKDDERAREFFRMHFRIIRQFKDGDKMEEPRESLSINMQDLNLSHGILNRIALEVFHHTQVRRLNKAQGQQLACQAPPSYPVLKQWEPEHILAELAQGLDELRVFYKEFGLKLPLLLFDFPSVKARLIPDYTLLRLCCLGQADAYKCVEKVFVHPKKALPGRFPLLWWLLAADVRSLKSGEPVHLWLMPEPGSGAPTLEMEIDDNFLTLRVDFGGKYQKFVQLHLRVTHRATGRNALETLHGESVPPESRSKPSLNSGTIGEPQLPSTNAMIRFMFPHPQSKWRSAMTDRLRPFTEDEESVLVRFAQACKCTDDDIQLPMTAEQDSKCRQLVNLSPAYAKEHLLSHVGKEDGPLSRKPQLAPTGTD